MVIQEVKLVLELKLMAKLLNYLELAIDFITKHSIKLSFL